MTARAADTGGAKSLKSHMFANGDSMPLIGLGTWKSEPGEVYKAVREAIRVGYRHIDCALLYGNEAEIGKAIRDAISAGDVTRKDLWITSKLWCNAHGRDNVAPALKTTLADLGLAYLDLYLIHWPIPLKPSAVFPRSADDFMPLAEVPLRATWAGMEAAVEAGLVRHIGVSNFSAKKLGELIPHCKIKIEVNQVERHPLLQQDALVGYCAAQGIHVTAYSPLGSSDRPAFVKAADAPVLLDNPEIRAIAETRGVSPAQVLIAWQVQQGVSVVPKSVTPSRLMENLAAGKLELTQSELDRIARLDRGYRLIAGEFWVVPGAPWTMQTLWDEGV